MFVAQSKKGSAFFNGLILFAIVFVACAVALAMTHMKKDPNDPEGFKNTFALKFGKKK